MGDRFFINAKGLLYNGALNGGDDGTRADWILYGASTLRHEQWHRDHQLINKDGQKD